jgi:hypothetical protein
LLRRTFLGAVPPALLYGWNSPANAASPNVSALGEPHFPSRLYQFVWRNWELANLDRMAQVVQAKPDQLAAIGAEMSLPPKRELSDDYLRRIYITVIRQNWHLLPQEQIVELLGWNADRFAFTLKEDDFLDHKLGPKPECEPLRYQAPTDEERRKAGAFRNVLKQAFPKGIQTLGQPRFSFVAQFSQPESHPGWQVETSSESAVLQAAAKRFSSGSGKRVELEIANSYQGGPGSFEITPQPKGARILAADERGAIRALYALRDQRQWPEQPQTYKEIWPHRFLYSYFALYGDPLMEGDAAGLPDGYLDRAAANGMNGVWIQGVLNNLAPSRSFPEFGKDSETRLKNLQALVERAERFGLRVYLYLNEPRSMPAEFFRNRMNIRGTPYQNLFAMCTSTTEVQDWLRQSLSHVFRQVPSLGGVFTITMSENHTNCFSHGGAWGDRNPVATGCPRCSKRTGADTIAEFVQTIRDGVREQSRTAEIMSYDWGWGTPLAEALIPKLPKDTSIISISEWSQPVSRGGVNTTVGEYSMSVVGPGPRATKNWALARRQGVAALAKTQFNNTWEISAVPYIPVLPLVLDHAERLAKAGISGVMASWTCGGYPGSNLRASSAYAFEPPPSRQEILQTEAERIYGKAGMKQAMLAWETFSEAFQFFPYGVAIYVLPVQHGPANPLRLHPTGLAPGMILFPYDAYKSWSGAYPPATVQKLLSQLAAKWVDGVKILERLNTKGRKEATLELAIARTCQTHFESAANQVEFYLLRDEAPGANTERMQAIRSRMIAIAQRERELARIQFEVTQAESLIGYEASNHYYYTPADLLEKILNCDQVISELQSGGPIGGKGKA